MNKQTGISGAVESVCRTAAGILMLFMMVFVFAEIVSRFVFGISHEYVPAISSWAMVWMTFFIFGLAQRTREHIGVDVLPVHLPRKYLPPLLTIYDITCLLFAILLCYGSIKYVLMVKRANVFAVTVQFIPMWIVRLSVPMGGVLLAFFSCVNLIDDIKQLIHRDGENKS